METTEGARHRTADTGRRNGAAPRTATGAHDAEFRDHGGHGVTGEGFAAARDAGPVEFGGIEFHRAGAFVRGRGISVR
ncbi:hypothetical protein SATRM34S_05199 [Streptomyces atroolivaceus]